MNTATISGNDFLDILFKGRNKDYGAYELRRKYDKRVRNAIMGTASIALAIIGGYTVSNHLMALVTVTRPAPPPPTILDPITQIETKTTPPPPALSSSNPPPARPSVRFTPPVIARQEDVTPEDVPPRMDDIVNKTVSVATTDGVEDGIDPSLLPETTSGGIEVPVVKERDDRDKPRSFVEIMPSFPGGEAALATYLAKNIRYPNIAAENQISGRVVIQFVVDYEGNINDVKVISDPKGGGLEAEAARVVKAMPKWKPGKQNGRTVSVYYTLPIFFRLTDQ